jgi:DNA-binding GntR family transcriptional regulator
MSDFPSTYPDSVALDRVVLGDKVTEFVIGAILNGEYRPGDRVVASTLARRLGVSQAPVREAMRELVMRGFLENQPFKGTTVRSFSDKELREVYAVRAALESLAARLAAELWTDEDLAALRGIIADMVRAGHEGDAAEMVRLDNSFHDKILQIAGNGLLYQLWQTLQFGYWTAITTRLSSLDLEVLARRHEIVLAEIASRDPVRAAEAMKHHIEDVNPLPAARRLARDAAALPEQRG